MSEPPVLPLDKVPSTAGPLLLGYMLNWALYGVLSVQVYLYYIAFPKDRMHSKLLVYGLFMIETIQSLVMGRDAFLTFVTGFTDVSKLTNVNHSWFTMPVLGGIVASIVQCFYAYRIMALSKSKYIASVIVVLSILQCSGALIDGILASQAGSLFKLTTRLQLVGHGIWDGACAICDVLIATYMFYFLSRMESQAGFKSTQAALSKIIQLTIGSGCLTAAVAIIDLTLFFADYWRGSFFLTPCAVLGKLYSNSMMVLLNSRLIIAGGRGNVEIIAMDKMGDSRTVGSKSRGVRSTIRFDHNAEESMHDDSDTKVQVTQTIEMH